MLKGIYLLILKVRKNTAIKVGSLGVVDFQTGYCVYVGSAQNNLVKRVQRHLSLDKKIRWHIDYLTTSAGVDIERVLFRSGNKLEECKTASILSETAAAVPGFGSSDCRCRSHLFMTGSIDEIKLRGFRGLEIEKLSR
ncbi:DUF123 domain-containing protein [candidate division KSB1 bacterium]